MKINHVISEFSILKKIEDRSTCGTRCQRFQKWRYGHDTNPGLHRLPQNSVKKWKTKMHEAAAWQSPKTIWVDWYGVKQCSPELCWNLKAKVHEEHVVRWSKKWRYGHDTMQGLHRLPQKLSLKNGRPKCMKGNVVRQYPKRIEYVIMTWHEVKTR